jgi:hypothetical protein
MFSTTKWLGAVALTVSTYAFGSVACSTTTITTVTEEGGVEHVEGGPKEGGLSTSSLSGDCATYCKKVESLNCANKATCTDDCENAYDAAPSQCKSPLKDLTKCLATDATFNGCADGKPKKKAGCDDEYSTVLKCAEDADKDAGKEAGGSGPDCKSITTGLGQACDTCMDTNCCAQESTCAGNPECNEYNKCVVEDGKPVATCKSEHPNGWQDAQSYGLCGGTNCADDCQN